MNDAENFIVNLFIFFVLFCIAGAIYTRIAPRSRLLQNAVGLT